MATIDALTHLFKYSGLILPRFMLGTTLYAKAQTSKVEKIKRDFIFADVLVSSTFRLGMREKFWFEIKLKNLNGNIYQPLSYPYTLC